MEMEYDLTPRMEEILADLLDRVPPPEQTDRCIECGKITCDCGTAKCLTCGVIACLDEHDLCGECMYEINPVLREHNAGMRVEIGLQEFLKYMRERRDE